MNRFLKCCLGFLAALGLMAQPGGPPGGDAWWGFGPDSRFAFMGFGPGMSEPVSGAPYSAVQSTTMVQRLADGNTIQRTEQANVYRDSQGRVRIEHSFAGRGTKSGETASRVISIFDPVAGSSYMLQPHNMTAVKSDVRPAGSRPMRSEHSKPHGSSATPAQTENLGLQTINGVAATGTRSTQTIPVGAIGNAQPIQIVREVWIAQDLKVPVMIKTSDPRFGETVTQLTNVVQANPDAALFQVPAGYTVHSGPARGPGKGHMPPPGGVKP